MSLLVIRMLFTNGSVHNISSPANSDGLYYFLKTLNDSDHIVSFTVSDEFGTLKTDNFSFGKMIKWKTGLYGGN